MKGPTKIRLPNDQAKPQLQALRCAAKRCFFRISSRRRRPRPGFLLTGSGALVGSASSRAIISLAADDDFNIDIVRAPRRAIPAVKILGVREAAHGGRTDPRILAWAAEEGRVLVAHDVDDDYSTRTRAHYWRLYAGPDRSTSTVADLDCGRRLVLVVVNQIQFLPVR